MPVEQAYEQAVTGRQYGANGVDVKAPPTVPETGLELLARTADGLGIAIAVGVHGQDVSILQVWR
jgi:hypothetical protein